MMAPSTMKGWRVVQKRGNGQRWRETQKKKKWTGYEKKGEQRAESRAEGNTGQGEDGREENLCVCAKIVGS